MSVFLTSDLHIFHKKICEYTDRHKVVSQEDHDEWIIDLWNKQVGKNDEVWSLGDFAFTSNYETLAEIIGKLNGHKHYVRGNHCDSRVWSKIKKSRMEDSRLGGVALVDNLKAKHFEINGKKEMFVMCHFAMRTWWNQHYGSFHVYGHSHGSLITDDRSMDVGLDAAYNILGEHRFFTIEEVYDILSKREIKSGDYHRAD